ncbi:MAG: nucleotidyltransferase domain-containing protein, partial [Proteobacteria bacterium]|nr:nucleotidyltransferase domain-containing protein [Pseudomonadota bacterium]
MKVILFGSAAENKMTDQSDFDFLVIHSTEDAIKSAQKSLRPHYPLSE